MNLAYLSADVQKYGDNNKVKSLPEGKRDRILEGQHLTPGPGDLEAFFSQHCFGLDQLENVQKL